MSTRLIIFFFIGASLCSGSVWNILAGGLKGNDRLVSAEEFLSEEYSDDSDPLVAYRKLWQKKLLLTPGDVARFVSLPGTSGKEIAVSIYRDRKKKNGRPGGYWLTVTGSSVPLWNCVPQETYRGLNPQSVTVDRCDFPLPESTALAVRQVWLTVLARIRPRPADLIRGDSSSTELLSAKGSNGIVLRGRFPDNLKPNTIALMTIANLLMDCCNVPEHERLTVTRKIETAANALLKRLK
jgi:hypothetical protein